jgi:hypothetical protein
MIRAHQDVLIRRSVDPSAVRVVGQYTIPRTYGVYRLRASPGRGREYRLGNHPVRHQELVRDYGAADLKWLFYDRADAVELAALLNQTVAEG